MEDKISIIIPVYNIQDYLGATLDSVLAQTYENLEIIVVNDGSTDGTADVIDTYVAKDRRIRAIHKENGGVTSARLRGVAEATGAYIGFVDGDDFIEPQMYQRLLENIKKYNAEISHCGYQMVFPDGHIDYYYNSGILVTQDRTLGLKELLAGSRVEPSLCNKIYSKSMFDKILQGTFQWEEIKNTEDLLMNYFLFKEAHLSVFEDVCPYHYMLRRGSAATAILNEHKLKDPLKVIRIIKADCDQEIQSVVCVKLVRQLINGATMRTGSRPDLVKPFREELRLELRKMLWSILIAKEYDMRLKMMALWSAVWPASYGWVHQIYQKLSGIEKKYQIS